MKAWIQELCPEIAEWQAQIIAEEVDNMVSREREAADAEIHLLHGVNESLRSQNESLDAECARLEALREYVPMTDDERYDMMRDWYDDKTEHAELNKHIETVVIKRAGLRIKERDNG